jgi:phage terminase large subunit GpA-like protein
MDCISNDDIREITFVKSARVGYTKMILAAIGYFAEHKHRNQAIWQPVDDDADEFVKTELDPMIRDVPSVRAVFPFFAAKNKNNTLRQKVFLGSTLHVRGGKAEKNYRRISVDVAMLDELDGFDTDVERAGDPVTLAAKRIEGSTFPKLILGSTPKTKHDSLIEGRAADAEHYFRYHVPCPECGHEQPLRWGGKDVPYGFKWVGDDASTAAYLCESCSALFTQDQFLANSAGRYVSDRGVWIDPDGLFRSAQDVILDAPISVAFHIWTAYSPMTSWTQIVREFLAAKSDPSKLKTFVNTTLGEAWEEDAGEKLEADLLHARREHYRAEVPDGAMVLTAGIDTQDDRFEIQVDAWGSGEERWSIDYVRLYGDPSRPEIWDRLAEALQRQYRRADGVLVNIRLAVQDHGGHFSDEVNGFSRRMGVRFLIPGRGSSHYGKPVAVFPRRPNLKRVYLTEIGTDTAKELLYQRLQILDPGAGYWHWPVSDAFDETYFKQLTAEKRLPKWTQGRKRYVWDAQGRRNEAWDCSVMSLAGVRILQQHFGLNLESAPPAPPTPPPKAEKKQTYIQRPGAGYLKR